MSDETASQHDLVKAAVLRVYELRPEGYRLQYSELKTAQGQSYSEVVANKSGLFDKWVASHHVVSYTELRKLVILQEIKMGYQLAYVFI